MVPNNSSIRKKKSPIKPITPEKSNVGKIMSPIFFTMKRGANKQAPLFYISINL